VVLAQTVEMDREGEIGAGREQVDLLLDQERVGAQVDELPALDQRLHDLGDLLVNQRFPARDGDDRRAAFGDRVQALLERQAPVQDRRRIVDLAAAGAG
jgi:hypothetical protein